MPVTCSGLGTSKARHWVEAVVGEALFAAVLAALLFALLLVSLFEALFVFVALFAFAALSVPGVLFVVAVCDGAAPVAGVTAGGVLVGVADVCVIVLELTGLAGFGISCTSRMRSG